ncbi:MAG: HNH endonuclease, partial [Woeseiaceae bacterium]|nr:HNH endonuclease [Woeseiaceae bacterium]
IGRKSRVIPPAMRRALRARDDGCRFPGCTNTFYIDGHHIEHWANGGETSLDNLVQLCRHHHRLVHEGGFACEKDANGRVTFRDTRQQVLGTYVLPTPLPDNATIEDWMVSHMQDIEIDDTTCVPNWRAGDKMDWNLAVGHLFQCRPN